MSNPLVSVLVPTYNHEKYIEECIKSLLNQSYSNLEILVSNDGSQDRTGYLLSQFEDRRIKVFHQENQGPSAALNRIMREVQGEYIVFFSGDDVALPDKVSRSLNFLHSRQVDLCFSFPELIDFESRPVLPQHMPVFFQDPPQSNQEFLRKLFYSGNTMCASTAFSHRRIFGDLQAFPEPFAVSSLQLQDFIFWARVFKKYKVSFFNEVTTQYRVGLSGAGTLSSQSNDRRKNFELYCILEKFFDEMTTAQLRECFSDHVVLDPNLGEVMRELDISFIFLSHPMDSIKALGLKRLFYQLQEPAQRKLLKEHKGFSQIDFFRLANEARFGF